MTLEALPQLQQQLNQALSAEIPPRLLRKPQKIAIDFHDRPYYGKASQEQAKWVRGRAKDGTTRFFRIATAYCSFKRSVVQSRRGMASREVAASESGGRRAGSQGSASPFALRFPPSERDVSRNLIARGMA